MSYSTGCFLCIMVVEKAKYHQLKSGIQSREINHGLTCCPGTPTTILDRPFSNSDRGIRYTHASKLSRDYISQK